MKTKLWLPCLVVISAAGGALFLASSGEEAEASFTSEATKDLVKFAKSGASLNLRLQAIQALVEKTETGIEAELEGIAKNGDRRIAIFACTALGKRRSSAAKSSLKNLFQSTSLSTLTRKSAMSAVAVHWKDPDDLAYFDTRTRILGDSDLRAHYLFVKSRIYRR